LSRAQPRTHGIPARDEGTIASLPQETATDPAVVQGLYEEEVAVLEAQSSIKTFIGVIAARRVRDRLTAPRENRRSTTARPARQSRVA